MALVHRQNQVKGDEKSRPRSRSNGIELLGFTGVNSKQPRCELYPLKGALFVINSTHSFTKSTVRHEVVAGKDTFEACS